VARRNADALGELLLREAATLAKFNNPQPQLGNKPQISRFRHGADEKTALAP
jgi:hypothetical protein